jgi:hypothetical protein
MQEADAEQVPIEQVEVEHFFVLVRPRNSAGGAQWVVVPCWKDLRDRDVVINDSKQYNPDADYEKRLLKVLLPYGGNS